MDIVEVSVSDLKEAEYNPRRATRKQFDDLAKSITTFGFVEPIVVNKNPDRKNVIVGGHFRFKVAKSLNYKTVPCVFIDVPLEKEMELNLRLNKNSGEFDRDMLANLDRELLFDVGFHPLELNAIYEPSVADMPEQPGGEEKEQQIKKCPRCGHEFKR
jgi:ParB family chromosome partitioning protein